MFDTLSDRLGSVFDRLKGRGALNEQDVRDAMREVRIALLEADVALPVVRRFIDAVTEKAIGAEVLRSVTPGQQVVKIVNDELVAMLAGEDGGAGAVGLTLDARPPVVVMMVGLQGSGKTTSTAKIARHIRERHGKKALMASLDVNRPAAQEQLAVLGQADGRRDPADRRRTAAGRHRPPRAGGGAVAGGRRAAARHRRPAPCR